MSDSVDILKKLALQVRNASTEGENTAERIGRIFIGILENMDNSDIEKLTKYFLRKDKEDSTNFLLSLLGGVFPEVTSVRTPVPSWRLWSCAAL